MTRFLLDAHLSPRTAAFLADEFSFDVTALRVTEFAHVPDADVIEVARRQNRVIITFDVDFGRLYYRYNRGQIGIIVLRLSNQRVDAVNAALGRFFTDSTTSTFELAHSLVIIDERRIRVTTDS